MKLKSLENPCTEFRSSPARASGAVIEREGGDNGAGLIRGFAVITRGEALGHGFWVDSDFLQSVVDNGNRLKAGQKMRFMHPSLSNDGLGKFLGRAKDFRLDGDIVRADMHFSESAHDTPNRDLASYVMSLAEEDPDMFGASIVFRSDRGAEDRHRAKHTDKDGNYKSPDPENKSNLPHVRLAALRAVDVVDSPAANKDGFFSEPFRLGAEIDECLEFALGLSPVAPEDNPFGIDITRISGAVRRFMDNRGLMVAKQQQETTEMAATETKEPVKQDVTLSQADIDKARETGAAAERQRVAAIRKLGRDCGIEQEVIDKACDDGLSEEKATKVFLESLRGKRDDRADVTIVQDVSNKREAFAAEMEEAVLMNAGLPYDTAKLKNPKDFRGLSMQGLAARCFQVENPGKPVPMSPDKLFTSAISTISLPQILGSTLNRTLAAAYTEHESTFMKWAGRRSVKDFRQYSDVKMSAFANPELVGAGGELKHDAPSEKREVYDIDTYGKMFTITRQDFINDDLNAFARSPMAMGQAMKRNIDAIGYALLISASGVGPTLLEDSVAVFSASHSFTPTGGTAVTNDNYLTGATSTLSETSLSALKTKLRLIKGMRGEPLNIVPRFLLVPAALEFTAKQLISSSTIMVAKGGTAGSIDTEYKPTTNVHFNSLEVIVEPRLDAGTNGTTAFYIGTTDAGLESFIVAFLNGNENPIVEQVELSANVLGLGWRAYHDVGVAAVDYRGIARSKGAA